MQDDSPPRTIFFSCFLKLTFLATERVQTPAITKATIAFHIAGCVCCVAFFTVGSLADDRLRKVSDGRIR